MSLVPPGAPRPDDVPTPTRAGWGIAPPTSPETSPAAVPGGPGPAPVVPPVPQPSRPGRVQTVPGAPTHPMSTMQPGIIPLRPLGVGQILEGAFRAVRGNPKTFLGLPVAIGAASAVALLLLAGVVVGIGYLGAGRVGSSWLDSAAAIGFGLGLTVTVLLTIVLGQVLSGMLAYPVGEAVLGRKPGLGEVWRRARRRVLPLVGLTLLLVLPVVLVLGGLVAGVVWAATADRAAVAVLLGLLAVALGLGTIYLGVRVILAYPALVLEETSIVGAVRRSWVLTRGNFWRTFGALVLANIITSFVSQVLGQVLQLVGLVLTFALVFALGVQDSAAGIAVVGVSLVASLVTTVAVTPYLAAVHALVYVDDRMRNEGFDLTLQRAAVEAVGRASVEADPQAASRTAPLR